MENLEKFLAFRETTKIDLGVAHVIVRPIELLG